MLPKYRCYIHSTGEMLPVRAFLQMHEEIGPIVFPKGYHRNFSFSEGDVDLMQYTGRKDKNGVDIYAGDIIMGIKGEQRAPRYAVYWDEELCAWIIDHKGLEYYLCDLEDITIIGNIHQNQELLK